MKKYVGLVILCCFLLCGKSVYAQETVGFESINVGMNGEVSIEVDTNDTARVRDAIVSVVAAREGTSIKTANDYNLVFESPIASVILSLLYTDLRHGIEPVARLSYTIVPQREKTLIRSRGSMVSLPNTMREQQSPATGKKDVAFVHNLLQLIKAEIEPGYEPQIVEIGKKAEKPEEKPLEVGWVIEDKTITSVKDGSAAGNAKLQSGDTIEEVNLVPASEIQDINALVLEKWGMGNSVTLVCDREGEKIVVTLRHSK